MARGTNAQPRVTALPMRPTISACKEQDNVSVGPTEQKICCQAGQTKRQRGCGSRLWRSGVRAGCGGKGVEAKGGGGGMMWVEGGRMQRKGVMAGFGRRDEKAWCTGTV